MKITKMINQPFVDILKPICVYQSTTCAVLVCVFIVRFFPFIRRFFLFEFYKNPNSKYSKNKKIQKKLGMASL